MAAKCLFTMTNTDKQGSFEGVCTAASLIWAKRCLKLGRGIGTYAELGVTDHEINGQMAVIKKYDTDPTAQCKAFDLSTTGDTAVDSVNAVYARVTTPFVCIFWNSYHTMGLRRGEAKQGIDLFDKNFGCYTADNITDIAAAYAMNYSGGTGANVITGMRVVTLA